MVITMPPRCRNGNFETVRCRESPSAFHASCPNSNLGTPHFGARLLFPSHGAGVVPAGEGFRLGLVSGKGPPKNTPACREMEFDRLAPAANWPSGASTPHGAQNSQFWARHLERELRLAMKRGCSCGRIFRWALYGKAPTPTDNPPPAKMEFDRFCCRPNRPRWASPTLVGPNFHLRTPLERLCLAWRGCPAEGFSAGLRQ